jgi:hypothetical protein
VGCLTSLACGGPTIPSADVCRSVRTDPSALSPTYGDNRQISQGQTPNGPRIDAGLIKHTPCGWRTSRSRARSSRVCHTSYPVPVRRPARVDGASSRPHLTVDALALFLAFGSANTWREDLHLARAVPCLAHTLGISGGAKRRPLVGSGSGAGDRDPGFHPLPRRTVREVCPHTALRQPSACGIRGHGPHIPGG